MTNEPHSSEAERSVLGAVLIDANTWPAVSHLTVGDFYRADHRAIYAALAELDERRETVRELVNGCDDESARARLRERLYLAFGPRPGHPAVAFRAAVERIQPAPVLVVVDTLMKAFAFEDANDYGATGETMTAITALAHDTGAHVMLVHHARKDNTGHADLATAALGSTRIGADVDVLARVLVAQHDGREVRRVSFIGRDGVNAADVDVAYAGREDGTSGGNPYA